MKQQTIALLAGGIVISTVALAALHDDGVDSDAFGASSTNTIGAQTHSAAFGTTLTATSMSVAIGTSGSAESKALSVGHVCNSYDRSLAVGVLSTAESSSCALGFFNKVEATYSIAAGVSNDILVNDGLSQSGSGNFLAGSQNEVSSNEDSQSLSYNLLLGHYNVSDGDNAILLGRSLQGLENVVVVGKNNDAEATNLDGAVFVVGSGWDSVDRSNALIVYDNDDVVLNKAQGDISMGIYAE